MTKPPAGLLGINKRKILGAAVVGALLGAPIAIAWPHVEPLLFKAGPTLFTRLPVVFRDLSPIPIREGSSRRIPVRIIPKGAGGIPVKHGDLSKIPITHKAAKAQRLEDLPGLQRVRTRHTNTSGLQAAPQLP